MRVYAAATVLALLSLPTQNAIAQTSVPPPPAHPCKPFAEGDNLTFTGFLAITDQKREEGEVNSKPYTFVFLDKPICFAKALDEPMTTIEVDPAPRALLGRHVNASGKMVAGDAWRAEGVRMTFKSEK